MESTPRELAFGSPDYEKALTLRDEVLRKPLGLAWTQAECDAEKDARHLGCFADGIIAGVLLLTPIDVTTVRMRQVAIEASRQGQGIGTRLVTFAEDVARDAGFREIVAHAREGAMPFYRRLGYVVEGEPFVEVSIMHFTIRKRLDSSIS